MKTVWKLFAYLDIDHAAAQDQLNAWAGEGWELMGLLGPFAKLRRTERTDLTWFLDWTDPKKPEEDYLQLCDDAGWELRCTEGYLNYFASKPGASPAPIQTDPELEYQRFRKKALRRMVLAALPALVLVPLVLLTFWLDLHQALRLWLSENIGVVVALCAPGLLVAGGAYFFYLLSRLLSYRRAALGGETPPAPRHAKAWGLLRLARSAFTLVLSIALLADILYNDIFSLPPLVLFILFSLAVLAFLRSWVEYKEKFLGTTVALNGGYLCLVILCFLLRGPLGDSLPRRVPMTPVLPGGSIYQVGQRRDSLLLSSAQWDEEVLGEAPNYCRVEVLRWTADWAADWVLPDVPEEMVPVEGLEGVWRMEHAAAEHGVLLLRRDRTQMEVAYRWTGNPMDIPAAALGWLDALE